MPIYLNAAARARARGRGSLIPAACGFVAVAGRACRRACLGLAAGVIAAVALGGAAQAQNLRGLVDAAAIVAGIPARLAHAVIAQESGYDPAKRGAAGEWGLGQIKCATARSIGFAGSCGQLADAATNLRFSFAYLRQALNRGGHGCAGVSLYQRGIYGRPSCSRYGRQVMARAGG